MNGPKLFVGCGAFTGQSDPTLGTRAGLSQAHIVRYAETAEAEGLDSCWLGEHHLASDGYTSAVFPMLGALAARTSRLVLGTRVLLAPLHHAMLVAEDAAQVAVLAPGRLLLGLGIGYRREEFATLRVPRDERVARLVEMVEVCRKAWTGEPFEHHGPTVDARGAVCRPAPDPPPELWLGGRAAAALARAARLADGYVAPLGGPAETIELVARIDGETPAARHPLPVSSSRLVAVNTSSPADARIRAGLDAVLATYRSWKEADRGINLATVPQLDAGVAAGSVDEVVGALAPVAAAFAARRHHLVARLDYPGMTPDDVVTHLRVFAREVAPRLRQAVLDAAVEHA